MEFIIKPMTNKVAEEISVWKYDEPYSLYSMDGSLELIEELIGGTYYYVTDEKGELIGYFCYGVTATVPGIKSLGAYDDMGYVDIGLGMRPDLTGKGMGRQFLLPGMKYARDNMKAKKFRLTVAVFNERAIKAYEGVGFVRGNAYINNSPSGKREFLIMKCD